MEDVEVKNIASLGLKGGKRDNFFFCLLEYFPNNNRWFLKSLLQVQDEEEMDGDDAINSWIEKYSISKLVVDFPLTSPICDRCDLVCPGMNKCPQTQVISMREEIEDLLLEDEDFYKNEPKLYERERNLDDEVHYSKDILAKDAHIHLLSRSFKRKLKKGFLPYWHRPIDLWVWKHYYDQLLELFNISFDSFGNTSLMLMNRFTYLKRHFPKGMTMVEGNFYLSLIELHRAKIISKKNLMELKDIDLCAEARLDIIKSIEKKLDIFIYEKDLETIVKRPRAFEAFILALTGKSILDDKIKIIPEKFKDNSQFFIPSF